MFQQVGHCRLNIFMETFLSIEMSGADMVFQGSNTTDDGSVEYLTV